MPAIAVARQQAIVATARVVVLRGTLNAAEVKKIKHYCINPVDCREAALGKPASLSLRAPAPSAVPILRRFIAKSTAELTALGNELGLAMDAADLRSLPGLFP